MILVLLVKGIEAYNPIKNFNPLPQNICTTAKTISITRIRTKFTPPPPNILTITETISITRTKSQPLHKQWIPFPKSFHPSPRSENAS